MHRIAFLNILYLVLVILIQCGCTKKDDIQVINEMIDQGAHFAEMHQIGDLMDMTSDDFKAQKGAHNAKSVRPILFAAFKHYGKFNILFPEPTVDIDHNRATAVIYFMIISQDRKIPGLKDLYNDPIRWIEVAGEKADLYQLKLNLSKKGRKWLVAIANLEGFKGLGF